MKIEDHPAFHGWNATVKCVSAERSEAFEENRIYHIVNGDFKDELKGTLYGGNYESLEDLNDRCNAQFELVAAPDLPRICYVLGGEKTPLKVGETFQIKGHPSSYFVSVQGTICDDETCGTAGLAAWDAINHPEKIIRRPQFSEDEKGFMHHCVNKGYPIFSRLAADSLRMSNDASEWFTLPNNFLPHLTNEISPFDAAAYLESEEAK